MRLSPELVSITFMLFFFYFLVTDFGIQDTAEPQTIKFHLLPGIFQTGKSNILTRFKENLTA